MSDVRLSNSFDRQTRIVKRTLERCSSIANAWLDLLDLGHSQPKQPFAIKDTIVHRMKLIATKDVRLPTTDYYLNPANRPLHLTNPTSIDLI